MGIEDIDKAGKTSGKSKIILQKKEERCMMETEQHAQ